MSTSEKISLIGLKCFRMVLDPKSGGSHNDYGAISAEGEGSEEPPVPAAGAVTSEGGTTKSVMTQSDVYQRQPLLTETGGWTPGYCEDDDDKLDGLKRNPANGTVRIEVPTSPREEPRFPKEKMKTAIAFALLVFNLVLSTVSLALVHERVPDYQPLPDSILDHIPSTGTEWALNVSEIIIMISSHFTFCLVFLHKHRYIVFRRVCLILAMLYMMRSVTMYVTVLPNSSTTYHCSAKVNQTSVLIVAERAFQLFSGMGLSINGKHTYCGDYIYSGHTVVLVMSYLIILEYSPKRWWPLHWVSFTASTVGVIFVLIARGHYTIDVIIAYWVTTRLFWTYHTLANHAVLKNSSPHNLLSRSWWFIPFRYFEGNVGGPVPRVYNWPFAWPRRFHTKHPNRDS